MSDDMPNAEPNGAQNASQDDLADGAAQEAASERSAVQEETAETPSSEPDPAAIIQELNDKLLRAMAEAENTRRIAAREKADAAKYAVTNFARDILRVADFLGMAMMSVSEEARKTDQNLDNLYVGIDMTMKELLNVFEAQGIKPVPAEGQQFDHNIHEAVSQVENPDVPANTVLQVTRSGFTIQDRLLRPAQVIVSTGGAKADAASQNDAAEGGQKAPNAYEKADKSSGQAVDQET